MNLSAVLPAGFYVPRFQAPPRWVFLVLGLLLVTLLIWFAGPLVAFAGHAPLEKPLWRLVTIAVVVGAVLLWFWIKRLRAGRANDKMISALAAAPDAGAAADAPDLSAADVKAMEERAAKALEMMRGARVGAQREFVYELPWYVIIGPPGAGKTTALRNCGLHFPAAQEMGRGARARHWRHPHGGLVVHRPRRPDRHRRPLHHPGQRRGGGRQGVAGFPRHPQALPPAPAADRRDRGPARPGPSGRRRRRGSGPRPGRARAHQRNRPALRRAHAGLPAADQDGPPGRVHRVLRRHGRHRARAGVGPHLPPAHGGGGAGAGRGGRGRGGGRPGPPAGRPAAHPGAGRARHGAARLDLRLPPAGRRPARAAAAAAGDHRARDQVRAAAPGARRLLHQRHPVRPADRPAAGLALGQVRRVGHRGGRHGGQGAQLLPAGPAQQGHVPRGGAGRARPAHRAAAPAPAAGHPGRRRGADPCCSPWAGWSDTWATRG